MEDRKAELLDEVNQIITQYRQEVPGRRRAWPESIKTRIFELQQLGLERTDLAKQTGIPYHTIFKWGEAEKSPRFQRVSVVPTRRALPKETTSKPSTVTVTTRRHRPRPRAAVSTVTVKMPGGISIEGVSIEILLKLLPALKGGIP